MSKKTDVLVIGSGMAGLMAAVAAAQRGCEVSVVSEGMGALAISGGCIDLLGYDAKGARLDNPWDGMATLDSSHPYSLLGREKIEDALKAFCDCVEAQGLAMHTALNDAKTSRNMLLPTVMGTLKPSWLFQADLDWDKLEIARKILVLGVKGFRDFRPRLIINQLKRYPGWHNREFDVLVLPEPFKEGARSLNALDLAHVADRKQGRDWLLAALKGKGQGYDVALLPPMLGAKANSPIRTLAPDALGCPCVELQSIPPGVGGMRIRDALVNYLVGKGVEFYENAQVSAPEVKERKCLGVVVSSSGKNFVHKPQSVVVATGGVLNGGIILGEGVAKENVFGIELPVPANVDEWTSREIFAEQPLAKVGVKVDASMRPVDGQNAQILENVFFAGQTLGGYDYTREKSGQGVAISTGWVAGCNAADVAKNNKAGVDL